MNDDEFALVKTRLKAITGIDLECYKSPQIRRRLDSYLGRVHLSSWPEFLRYLSQDAHAAQQVHDYLAINVSSFFRDYPKWEELRRSVLPQIKPRGGVFRVWSAGCSHGAEAYSLAMLLEGVPGVRRYRVHGTDIDRATLDQARAGGPYPPDAVRNLPSELLERHFRQEGTAYWISRALQEKVRFREHDLLRIFARSEFDLILCRNVLIYFTEEAKAQVIDGLIGALKPGGVLFIGATESIANGKYGNLERMGISFYRRTH